MVMSIAEVANITYASKQKKVNPITEYAYVQAGDIDGVNFVSGSEGNLKTVLEYADLNKVTLTSTTNLKYGDPATPTKPTEVEVV